MSLFSLGLLAAYFAGGMQYMMNQEGWDAADAFYFWCCPCINQIVAALRPRHHATPARLICAQVHDREHRGLRRPRAHDP